MSQAGRMPLTKFGAKLLQEVGSTKNVPIRLKAGAQRSYRLALSRMIDLTLSGTYSVTVHRFVPGRPPHLREGSHLWHGPNKPKELVSNELTVEITEPPTPNL